jgi:hypothetical protein
MIELRWVVAGVIFGMLLSTVFVPPTRKQKILPQPHDSGLFHTESGCVRFVADEVPCNAEPDSLNLLASK